MKKTICLLITFFCIGCASTKIASITDPDYKGAKLKNIVIVANVDDLIMRQSIEQKFTETMINKYDIKASSGYEILPPTRQYTEIELKNILAKNNIDSVLILTVKDSGYKTSTYTSYEPYKTQGYVSAIGTNQYQYQSTTYGGPKTYTIDKPYLSIKTEIVDPINGKTIWVATSDSGGNSCVGINFLLNDYIDEIAQKISEDGLISRKRMDWQHFLDNSNSAGSGKSHIQE